MSEKKGTYVTKRYHDPIDDLLDRPIAFNPAFKKITGSTVAALMLSQAYYWSKRTSDNEGWFYKTVAEWEEETGLTRSEQETARKHLKGIMEVDLRGVPATLYYRVDKEKVKELLGVQFATIPQTEIAETLQTSLLDSGKQDGDNPANINSTETTTENTQTQNKKFSNPLWDLQHGKTPTLTEDDTKQAEIMEKVEEVATKLERGLRLNFPRGTKDQQIYRRIAESGNPIDRFIEWVKAEERRLSFAFLYAKDTAALWRDFPQAFPNLFGTDTEESKGSFYG